MAIRRLMLATVAAWAALSAGAAAEDFSAMSCTRLWAARSKILKARGYCFTDPKAVRAFGNDGCSVTMQSRLPLTARERDDIARIVLAERMKLCP